MSYCFFKSSIFFILNYNKKIYSEDVKGNLLTIMHKNLNHHFLNFKFVSKEINKSYITIL